MKTEGYFFSDEGNIHEANSANRKKIAEDKEP